MIKFIMLSIFLMPAYSFAMDLYRPDLSLKKKHAEIDVCDVQNVVDKRQERFKKTSCCVQTCGWVTVTCIGLAALCLKLEYGCACKQP